MLSYVSHLTYPAAGKEVFLRGWIHPPPQALKLKFGVANPPVFSLSASFSFFFPPPISPSSVLVLCQNTPVSFLSCPQETDILEEEKAELEAEISELQKEKERLEFVLVAHQPNCKIPYQDQPQQGSSQLPPLQSQLPPQTLQPPVSIVGLAVKEDSFYLPPAYTAHPASTQPQPPVQQQQVQQQPGIMQEVEFSSSFYGSTEPAPGGPCLMASDSGGGGGNDDAAAIGSYNTSYTSSFVFTYPEGACGVSANQRNSSSEQSSDSLNSPSLLALWLTDRHTRTHIDTHTQYARWK